jgi:uncharacterized protein (TIGR03437 family)
VKALPLLLLSAVVGAQTPPNWTQQFPQSSPPARDSPSMAYDSAHGQVIMFGGLDSFNIDPDGLLNDTWAWEGANWTPESPQTSPPARYGHAMAYDSTHGQVLLFGGRGENQSSPLLNDTWVWDGSNWTQKFPQTSPPSRFGHAMVYDPAHGQVLLFGGSDGSSSPLGDTWVWDGSNWTQKSPQTSPPGRRNHAMTYDIGHRQVVLFGGVWSLVGQNDTWVWNGSNWTQKSPQTSPSARQVPLMLYDSALGQAVLFGGVDNHNQELNDTWAWNGSNWIQQSPQNSPSVRSSAAIAYDSGRAQAVLFCGQTGGTGQLLFDTWTYGIGPAPVVPSISGVVSASDFGGFANVALGSWVEIYGSNLAPHTRGWTVADFISDVDAPTSLDGVSVSLGGQPAFVDYISPTQVNAQLPNANLPISSTFQLTVTYATATSAPVNLIVNATEPGLLAPPSFKIGGNQYVVAQFVDGTYVLPTGAIAGVNSRPAMPGETIVIYGVGFGLVSGNIFAGQIPNELNQLIASFQILFGQTPAQLSYFGLAPNFVGLYQFNVVVPPVADSDLVPLTFNLGGVAGAQTLFTAVHQ